VTQDRGWRISAGVKLVVVHSHFRPGGVRRVIELALPHVAGALRPRATSIVLVAGEAPDAGWLRALQDRVAGISLSCAVHRALGYVSESVLAPDVMQRHVRRHLARVLGDATPQSCVVWAHNLGLGRNLLLARELARVCQRRRLPFVSHHHDWWFDNRWQRWPEMQRTGSRSLIAVARIIFAHAPGVRHATINRADAALLARHFGRHVGWLPNPADRAPPVDPQSVRSAREWLAGQLGTDAPVWLLPCRLLRRKNIAEALLLARWLRPEAWLVTTGGVSSSDEEPYASALRRASVAGEWPLRLGILAGDESAKPSVPALLEASEAVLLTSLQEGFGLPNLEAAAAARPLITRALPNIAPDLAHFGFEFPQSYADVRVAPQLFDWSAEIGRQSRRWRAWRERLPRACRALADTPPALVPASPEPVAFSRLTLHAQLEVLAHAPAHSWRLCAPLNPFLRRWRQRAAAGELRVSHWPRTASHWLSGAAYGRRLQRLLRTTAEAGIDPRASRRVAEEFIRAKLAGPNQYPLLWTPEP
jgi:glycosyltransferase involved in cell wall biosynthesis